MPVAIARKYYVMDQTPVYKIIKVYDILDELEELLPEVYRLSQELSIPESDLIIVYSD